MLPITLDSIRISLHVLAVTVWVGGQIVVAGIVPVLRTISDDAPRLVARRFSQVAWPFFGLAVLTGVWNMIELPSGLSVEYHATLGTKMLLVTISGLAAFFHSRTESPAVRGVTGGLGLISALGALFLGVLL